MAVSNTDLFDVEDIVNANAESVFQRLVQRGNRGTIVRSTAAPALSTQFVKSKKEQRLHAGSDGYLAGIMYPNDETINARHAKKHAQEDIFGYAHTKATDGFPGGFGERSARALAREENTYQFKGTFPSALLAFAKLRARVNARNGSVTAIDRIFAMLWGLSVESVASIPHLCLDGSEPTRMSAMEDRAYHALSGHPGHNGGYRVDLATIAADALGDDVPINWPRIRTALKAIALCQTQGDLTMMRVIHTMQQEKLVEFGMDLVQGSQPTYARGYPWELVLDRVMTNADNVNSLPEPTDAGYAMTSQLVDSYMSKMEKDVDPELIRNIQRIAQLVTTESSKSLRRTVEVILELDRDRAYIDEKHEELFEELDTSVLSTQFKVPRYKVTRDSIRQGFTRPFIGADNLPDMKSHGTPRQVLDLREFRASYLGLQLNVAGVLNLAVYFTCLNTQTRNYAYQLLNLVKKPVTEEHQKTSVALRKQSLYDDDNVRALGPLIFNDAFINSVDLLLKNVMSPEYRSDLSIKKEMWSYLNGRCSVKRRCPYAGDWRNLLNEIIHEPEGWTLFYWVRISIGKSHHVTSSGILAPIAAGQVTDFLTLMKRSVREKAARWTDYYSSKYKLIEDKLADQRLKRKEREHTAVVVEETGSSSATKYVPPHLRKQLDLEHTYDADEILNRDRKYDEQEYRQMVEMQSKSKFFKAIDVFANDGRITVGVTDEKMYQMLVEFYQARWFSLEKRIQKAKERNRVFRLGMYEFHEHPWGPLNEELPSDYESMLSYVCSLDGRAWTLPPNYLQDKFRKSISELWNDIGEEIGKICTFIDEVYNDLAADQTEADIASASESLLRSTIGIPPVVIPTPGYVPPFTLPRAHIDVENKDGRHVKKAINPGMSDPTAHLVSEPSRMDVDTLEDADDDDDGAPIMAAREWTTIDITYLTYREIWHQLALPDVPDEKMRYAFLLPADIDLDQQHVESQYGPLVQPHERHMATRKWVQKKGMLLYRLGQRKEPVVEDDM